MIKLRIGMIKLRIGIGYTIKLSAHQPDTSTGFPEPCGAQ